MNEPHFPPKDQPVVVTFTQASAPYNAGDNASFDARDAESLVRKKLAVLTSTSVLDRLRVTKSQAHAELEARLAREAGGASPAPIKAEATPTAPVEAKEKPAPASPPPQPGPSADRGRKGHRR